MGWLWSAAGEGCWRPDLPPWLENALARIEREPQISVGELAREAHFSPAQFRRLWEKHLGSSPRATLLRRRLEIARSALESGDCSIGEIAARSGFAGASQLSRAFRTAFGAAPFEWKRAAQNRQ